jgi:hypothetical protein
LDDVKDHLTESFEKYKDEFFSDNKQYIIEMNYDQKPIFSYRHKIITNINRKVPDIPKNILDSLILLEECFGPLKLPESVPEELKNKVLKKQDELKTIRLSDVDSAVRKKIIGEYIITHFYNESLSNNV